jgi:hypothetical protein
MNKNRSLETKLRNHILRTVLDGEEIFIKIAQIYHSCNNDWNHYEYIDTFYVLTKKQVEEYLSNLERRLKELKSL